MTTLAPLPAQADPKWYLVRTLRYREAEADKAIGALELETYLPHETHYAKRGRKLIKVSAPLFRQYVFTRFDIDRDPWHRVRRLYWVDCIVAANEIPLRVPDRQVEAIRLAEQAGAYDATVLPKGTRVRILEGPFAGFIAEVRRASPRRRVELLLEFLGHQARIRVDRMSLVKV